MAKRRILKKKINYICGELFAEALSMMLYDSNISKDAANDVMAHILKMQDDIISRISHTQPGNVKGFYSKLHADLQQQVNEIFDQIINLH
ncbi:MAG: hypothetical protein MJZ69_03260 [Bacteroidaceae bacterium]|nr:hypothetical protein [Bacteroidaceae bacterium]